MRNAVLNWLGENMGSAMGLFDKDLVGLYNHMSEQRHSSDYTDIAVGIMDPNKTRDPWWMTWANPGARGMHPEYYSENAVRRMSKAPTGWGGYEVFYGYGTGDPFSAWYILTKSQTYTWRVIP